MNDDWNNPEYGQEEAGQYWQQESGWQQDYRDGWQDERDDWEDNGWQDERKGWVDETEDWQSARTASYSDDVFDESFDDAAFEEPVPGPMITCAAISKDSGSQPMGAAAVGMGIGMLATGVGMLAAAGVRLARNLVGQMPGLGWKFGSSRKQQKENALEAVRRDGMRLGRVPYESLTPEICMAAVEQNGRALRLVPPKFITPAMCLAAVLNSSRAFYAVPKEMQTMEFCLDVIRHDGWKLRLLPKEQRTPELCLEAVKHNGYALADVPERVKEDPAFKAELACVEADALDMLGAPRHRAGSVAAESVGWLQNAASRKASAGDAQAPSAS